MVNFSREITCEKTGAYLSEGATLLAIILHCVRALRPKHISTIVMGAITTCLLVLSAATLHGLTLNGDSPNPN